MSCANKFGSCFERQCICYSILRPVLHGPLAMQSSAFLPLHSWREVRTGGSQARARTLKTE